MSRMACKSGVVLAACVLLALCGCGTRRIEGSGVGAGTTAPFTLAITSPFTLGTTDDLPSNYTVLSFRITVTSAVLQPGNVSLISSPETIELTQLQTDNFDIATKDVATGNYTSLDVTFANPDMTIYNGAQSISNCAIGAICEMQPVLDTASFSLAPALTLTANTPSAVELELSINDSLQPDLSFDPTGGLTFTTPPSVESSAALLPLNTVAGVVTSVGSNQFGMTTLAGQELTIQTNSSTVYSYPATVCKTGEFACLATGQILSVDMNVLGTGALQANNVIFEDNSGDPAISGAVAAIDTTSNPPQITLVIHGQAPATTGIEEDNVATVSLQKTTTYLIDADVLTIPSGFTFASTTDLVVGQEILVRGNSIDVTPKTNLPSVIAISTNQVILRQSQWTGTVGIANSGVDAFTLTSLPDLFTNETPTAITNLYAITSTPTDFVNTNLTNLTAGTPVTLKGLIFSNTVNPVTSPSDVASIVQGAPNFPSVAAHQSRAKAH